MSKKSEKSLEESLNQKPEALLSEIKSETVTVDQANPNRLYLAAKQVHVDTSQFKNITIIICNYNIYG